MRPVWSQSCVSGVAAAQSLSIADSDSIFVDGNSLEVVPGKGKGNASALIDELDARDLGPGTIIFRSGNRLYLVDAPTTEGARLGSDRRDYGSDRRDYGSGRVVVNDDEYARYKLKKIFADNWTTRLEVESLLSRSDIEL